MPLYDTYDTKGRTGLKLRIYIWRRMRFRKTQYLFYPPRIKVSILLQEIREGRKERKVRKSLVGRPGTNRLKVASRNTRESKEGEWAGRGTSRLTVNGGRRGGGRREDSFHLTRFKKRFTFLKLSPFANILNEGGGRREDSFHLTRF